MEPSARPPEGRGTAGGLVGTGLYCAGRGVAALALRLGARPRLEGGEHVPRTGPLLVVANHVSLVDPPLLAVLLPRRLAFLTKEELFHPAPWGWALGEAGMIPVRRGRAERRVVERALAVLASGGALVVFPEGTRSRDGVLAPAEPGVGLLAVRSRAPVLPVGIVGTEVLRRASDALARPAVVVRCGPTWLPDGGQRGAQAYRAVADALLAHVAALLPAERRGVYAEHAAGGRINS
jgi:1-acyl-sn-glycerol-3-phosphate acyltransferase